MNDYLTAMLFIVIFSYLLGSIPTAYIVARLKNINIFEVGSGNMGATNVVRALGPRWGAGVLLFDVLKGVIAITLARYLLPDSKGAATTVSAIVVVIGHNWSLFAALVTGTLRGGKGAATAFGTLLMIAPVQVIVGMTVLGGLVVARTRYVSLGVLLAFALATIWMTVLILQQKLEPDLMTYSWVLALMIMVRFRDNIQRLLAGTERRLGERT
jgi:acyl phosphate:glycerol-3-phosphate acyltransferase